MCSQNPRNRQSGFFGNHGLIEEIEVGKHFLEGIVGNACVQVQLNRGSILDYLGHVPRSHPARSSPADPEHHRSDLAAVRNNGTTRPSQSPPPYASYP